jgi:hypothetical protein
MRASSWAVKQAQSVVNGQGELFDPPEYSPVWPAVGTLADMALTILLGGQSLNHHDFFEASGSWRLAAVVYNLHLLGWPVLSDNIPDPTEMSPHRTIAIYYLPAIFGDNHLLNNRSFS